jgi:hypothetical protein
MALGLEQNYTNKSAKTRVFTVNTVLSCVWWLDCVDLHDFDANTQF